MSAPLRQITDITIGERHRRDLGDIDTEAPRMREAAK
jgi:hypothetical protein